MQAAENRGLSLLENGREREPSADLNRTPVRNLQEKDAYPDEEASC